MVDSDDNLSNAAKQLPALRGYIEELPETAATFKLNQVDGLDVNANIHDVVVEFAGAWPISDIYDLAESSGRIFVNPGYAHSHVYTDLHVSCPCGAVLTRNYEDGNNALRDEHAHVDDCLPYFRLRARANMSQLRHQEMVRLGTIGWLGSEIAPRLGATPNSMGGLAQQFGFTLKDLRTRYRTAAGNTYAHLVRTGGVPAGDVAEAYGHARTTLTRWAQEYGDYETERGVNQFTRGKNGRFVWERIKEPAKTPAFLGGEVDV